MDFKKSIENHEAAVSKLKENMIEKIEEISILVLNTLKNGNTIFLCGNGGSAADSQHIAAEFVGRFVTERNALTAIALTTDTSILTAIGNDYGYDTIFRRQIEGLGKSGDLIIGISTSGNSANIVEAFKQAKKQNMKIVALTGPKESKMSYNADVSLKVPADVTARVQECHIMIGHLICEYIDDNI